METTNESLSRPIPISRARAQEDEADCPESLDLRMGTRIGVALLFRTDSAGVKRC